MDDDKGKPALSLNQLHNRFLGDMSTSQIKPIDEPVVFEYDFGNDDIPSFDFDMAPPSQDVTVGLESSKFDFDIPPLSQVGLESTKFDFDMPPPSQEVEVDYQSHDGIEASAQPKKSDFCPSAGSESTRGDDDTPEYGLDISHPSQEEVVDYQSNNNIRTSVHMKNLDPFPATGEERETKVRIEGRRRLCKVSKNNEKDACFERSSIRDEEPTFVGISDFDSPPQANKACESNGHEIRDILNDLSSRLEVLSIKKSKAPKEGCSVVDLQDSLIGESHDLHRKEGLSKHPTYNSPSLHSTFSLQDSINTECYKKGISNTGIEDEDMNSVANAGSSKQSHGYNSCRKEDDYNAANYTALSAKHNVAGVDRKKFIEISDDDTDVVTTLHNQLEDFSLSGPKGTYKLPGKIATVLYPHQREGLKWLWSLHCKDKGGILGDDMGLGKTMQICGFLAGLFHSKLIKRVLIVAPKTLLTHWIKELSSVGLSRMAREYFATCTRTRHYELQYVLQDKGILLTTYDIVRNNAKSLCGDDRYVDYGDDENVWDYMILDEGHLIKNPATQRAKSLLQIPCAHRVIISGTPIQNNLKELWALFNFCCPELLGDKKEFKDKYEYFISRGNEKNASDREKRIGSSVAKDLRDCIQPYFLRRLKSEVFRDNTLLSKKDEIIVWLRLTRCQRQVYEAFLKSEIVLSACDGSPLAALTILKKICDHPLLLTKRAAEDVLEGMDSIVNQEDHRVAEKLAMHIADVAERFDIAVDNNDISCKLSFVLSLLGNLIPEGHNVLIFSQSRKMLNIIQESLLLNSYNYMRIDGSTKAADRAKIVKDFQECQIPTVFLLTTQVGGLGLTLTNADRVIVVDPAWNPSTDNQSVDRAYRIGQKKDVIVYRLMTCSTVEEKIYKKQVFKGGLFKSATENKEQTRYFSQQDLKDLFSLPKHGFDVSLTQQQLLEEHDRQHTMEESLRAHVEFLETLNIAGVSHHSLLFSKTAPVQAINLEEEAEVERVRAKAFVENRSRSGSVDNNVDGAQFAFNPKDAKKPQRKTYVDVEEPTEDEIMEKIDRFSRIYSNKVAVSNLPDKGEKLQKQIAALNKQLGQLRMSKENNPYVID